MVELSNGCICCSKQGAMLEEVKKMACMQGAGTTSTPASRHSPPLGASVRNASRAVPRTRLTHVPHYTAKGGGRRFDVLVIESTGVSDPAEVAGAFEHDEQVGCVTRCTVVNWRGVHCVNLLRRRPVGQRACTAGHYGYRR